jgi:hypothetical protein
MYELSWADHAATPIVVNAKRFEHFKEVVKFIRDKTFKPSVQWSIIRFSRGVQKT